MKNWDATRNIPSWTTFDFFLWCSMKKLVWVHAEGRSGEEKRRDVDRLKWNFVCNIQIKPKHRKKLNISLSVVFYSLFIRGSELYLDLDFLVECVLFFFSNFNSCRLFTGERAVLWLTNPFINFSTSLFFFLAQSLIRVVQLFFFLLFFLKLFFYDFIFSQLHMKNTIFTRISRTNKLQNTSALYFFFCVIFSSSCLIFLSLLLQ